MMVGRLLSFWDGIYSRAMLNFQGVDRWKSISQFVDFLGLLMLVLADLASLRRWSYGAYAGAYQWIIMSSWDANRMGEMKDLEAIIPQPLDPKAPWLPHLCDSSSSRSLTGGVYEVSFWCNRILLTFVSSDLLAMFFLLKTTNCMPEELTPHSKNRDFIYFVILGERLHKVARDDMLSH